MDENNEQAFEFDKFMSDIVKRESLKETEQPKDVTPQREYAQKYRELPQNRTRWSR